MITEMTNHPLCYGALINVKAALSSLFKTVFKLNTVYAPHWKQTVDYRKIVVAGVTSAIETAPLKKIRRLNLH